MQRAISLLDRLLQLLVLRSRSGEDHAAEAAVGDLLPHLAQAVHDGLHVVQGSWLRWSVVPFRQS